MALLNDRGQNIRVRWKSSHLVRQTRMFRTGILLSIAFFIGVSDTRGNGLYRNGVGARSVGRAGADVAWTDSTLGAMSGNPAQLSTFVGPTVEFGGAAALIDARYHSSIREGTSIRDDFGAFPEAAVAVPLSHGLAVGLSAIPQSALAAEWRFIDPPGGADGNTSYGRQTHRSEIFVLRSALGLSWSPFTNFAIGASVGLLYNENELHAPYVFQRTPRLRGAKTLLDLETSGFGWDVQAGAMWRPHPKWQFGLSYKSRSLVRSTGEATGNAGVQFENLGLGSARPDFRYDAEVVNTFPQTFSGGASWQPHPHWRLLAQVDWINWNNSFDGLQVKLTDGNNADLNGVARSSTLRDEIPLDWRDSFVYRAGVEFEPAENWMLRGGYSYGRNPVPAHTATPLTAVIMEHSVSMGVGRQFRCVAIDLAYQWDIPNTQSVNTSALRSGEYSNTETRVGIHWLLATVAVRF